MRLRLKVPLIILISIALSGVCAGLIFKMVVLEEFRVLEDEQVKRNLGRLEESFQGEMRSLSNLVQDWALWGELSSYVQSGNEDFKVANLNYTSLKSLDISHLILLDSRRTEVFAATINDEQESLSALPTEFMDTFVSAGIVERSYRAGAGTEVRDLNGSFKRVGMLTLGSRAYLLAVSSIGEGLYGGKSDLTTGFLVMTREISGQLITRISEQTKLDLVSTLQVDISRWSPSMRVVDQQLTLSAPLVTKSQEQIQTALHLVDVLGKPTVSIQFDMPRDIFKKGLVMQNFLVATLGFVSLITASLVIILLNQLVLGPLAALVNSLMAIANTSNFHLRVPQTNRDELGKLGSVINFTLTNLQAALVRAENAQHAAEAANAAKSSFIAKVSHELRTPIHSVTGMLRILLKEEKSSSKRNYIMMAKNAAYGLLETINEILDFSKVEAGKLVLEKIEFSIHDVIRDSIQTVGPRVEEKGSLEAVVEVPQGIPHKLIGDPLRLKQVLVNLLGNAAKFTKAGHIGLKVDIVESDAKRALIEMTVFDTGVGIPADRIEHIFEPFSQADESVSRMFTGTGLGLTIVKQFIEGMGGAVRVESELGVGSRFILSIPFDIAVGSEPVVFRPILSSNRVAVIDGDSVVAERFIRELRQSGYAAEIVRSDQARELDILSQEINRYGLVIVTSEALKRSRVFDLVVELRGRESVPVVSVLSPFEISVRERLLALEVPFVVTRPVSLLDILGVVSGSLSLSNEGWEDAEDSSLQSERALEVLVADDAQTNRIILTELLRDAGHNVVCVENGVDLVSRVRDSLSGAPGAQRFDLILTDVQMPLLDGLNATAQIRSLERDGGIMTRLPIVAVTAHAMTDETSRMRQFGVDDVVTKPLDPIRLGQVIQRLTGSDSRAAADKARPATLNKINEAELAELGLRLWTQLAKRDRDIANLFQLSEDPVSPEDFQRVLDIGDVIERSGSSVRRTLLIFRGFLDCFREQLIKLGEAKQTRNLDDLRFAAHALKGLLLDVGARASSGLAGAIEQSSKDGQHESALGLVSQLTKQVLLVSRLVSQISQIASGENSTEDATILSEKAESFETLG
jgi:signal transduction histidine kinase/CheY-like chemotaxis protein